MSKTVPTRSQLDRIRYCRGDTKRAHPVVSAVDADLGEVNDAEGLK